MRLRIEGTEAEINLTLLAIRPELAVGQVSRFRVNRGSTGVGRVIAEYSLLPPDSWKHPAVRSRDAALARIEKAIEVIKEELRDAIWDLHVTSLERVRDALKAAP
ncbi:hypothetical protein F9C11_21645 [Amycolatopsis sp. VS8301801F10]|uniref:hypothetical protein n=1 Tax=Amycolatopsis sp. VS8301801F10 TaxID=2652442 RepID=UPI0038FC38D6